MNEPENEMDWHQVLRRQRDEAIRELGKCRARTERWHTKAVEAMNELERIKSGRHT
jgi:hypothetical protein